LRAGFAKGEIGKTGRGGLEKKPPPDHWTPPTLIKLLPDRPRAVQESPTVAVLVWTTGGQDKQPKKGKRLSPGEGKYAVDKREKRGKRKNFGRCFTKM